MDATLEPTGAGVKWRGKNTEYRIQKTEGRIEKMNEEMANGEWGENGTA